MFTARNTDEYQFYIAWLADYLYRPEILPPGTKKITFDEAKKEVLNVEYEIACWFYNHPFEDFPPNQPRSIHADVLHRPELSKILSRLPNKISRRKVLNRFYEEVHRDMMK